MKKICLLLILFILLITGCSSDTDGISNISEYITISVSGINGYGVLDYSIKENNSFYKIECNPDKTQYLSNGDIVTIYCDVYQQKDSNYYVITNEEFTYEVEGLEVRDLIKIDNLYDFSFVGSGDDTTITYQPKSTNNMVDDITLDIVANDNDGSYINVKIRGIINCSPNDFLTKYGVLIDPQAVIIKTKLKSLASSYEEIKPETIELLKSNIEQFYEEEKTKENYERYAYEYVDTYFGYDVSYDGIPSNVLYLIYSVDSHITRGIAEGIYQFFKFENIENVYEENDIDLNYSYKFGKIEDLRDFVSSDKWENHYQTWQ